MELEQIELRDARENTLSARVYVVTPFHPFCGQLCYLVRRHPEQPRYWLCELSPRQPGTAELLLGAPVRNRDWFQGFELRDRRYWEEMGDRL